MHIAVQLCKVTMNSTISCRMQRDFCLLGNLPTTKVFKIHDDDVLFPKEETTWSWLHHLQQDNLFNMLKPNEISYAIHIFLLSLDEVF